jgi:hypothetical protein
MQRYFLLPLRNGDDGGVVADLASAKVEAVEGARSHQPVSAERNADWPAPYLRDRSQPLVLLGEAVFYWHEAPLRLSILGTAGISGSADRN